MKITQFKKAPLAAGVALALGLQLPYGFAVAEEQAADGVLEEQIVYGIRESLKSLQTSSAPVQVLLMRSLQKTWATFQTATLRNRFNVLLASPLTVNAVRAPR